MSCKDRLLAQEALVDLMLEHQYIPQVSQQNFNQLLCALREYAPGTTFDPGCSGCLLSIAQRAKLFINLIKKEREAQFMTFPKHEPPIEIINTGEPMVTEKKKRGRPKKQ